MYLPLHLAAIFYVLTGGPSVGKTSIIKELEHSGEQIIDEAATDWIASRLEMGVKEFWKEENINYKIMQLQLERETPFLSQGGRVFIDRGVFDSFAYAPQFSLAGTKELQHMNNIVKEIELNHRYSAVFFILPFHQENFSPIQNEIRKEGSKEFCEIQAALYAIYCRHKHFIPVPGNLSPKKRAQFILDHVEKIESQATTKN